MLELTQIMPLATIAKEHLTIGKEKTTQALKLAGCYSKNGVRGWYFDGEPNVLEQSIYDFVASKPKLKNHNTSKVKSKVKASSQQNNNDLTVTSNQVAGTSELDAIDILLLENETSSNQRVYRGFYWDEDIINFINNVKHGNKSDLMNEIVRTVLKAKGLI